MRWHAVLARVAAAVAGVLPTDAMDYVEPSSCLDAGGGPAASADYRWVATLDGLGAARSAAGDLTCRAGFLGTAFLLGQVVDQRVFYNGSAFDGGLNGAGADARDDAAMAPDKVALFPGARAGFANYTSYSRGLNGILVDLAEPGAGLGIADFDLRTGNVDDHESWAAAPPPGVVATRPGAGTAGSSRTTLIWPDRAIQKTWLRVRVLPTDNTDLAEPWTFFFGNAVGESGNRAGLDAIVNATDEIRARANGRSALSPAPIDFPYDYNRDRLVNATDQILARLNTTSALSALRLITPVVTAPPPAPDGERTGDPTKRGPQTGDEPGERPVLPEPVGLAMSPAGSAGPDARPSPPPGIAPDRTTRLWIGFEDERTLWIACRPGSAEGVLLEWASGGADADGDLVWQALPSAARQADIDGFAFWRMDRDPGSAAALFRVRTLSSESSLP